MITHLQCLQTVEVSIKRLSKEELKKTLAPLQSLWDSLKDSVKSAPKNTDTANKDPIYCFVKLEIAKTYSLIKIVNESFKGITDVISGNGLMTSEIEKDIHSLVKSNIPQKWEAI